MPRGRRAASKPLTLGFAGSGALDAKAVTALLDDLADGKTVKQVIVPVTDALYTDAIDAVVEWAGKNDIEYVTVSDDDAQEDKDLKGVIADAADDYGIEESAAKSILDLLAGSEEEPVEDGRFLMFFDAENDDDVAAFEESAELDIPAFDMCDGLSPITFGDDDGGEPEPEPAPVDEVASRRSRRSAKAKEEPAEPPAGTGPTAAELEKLTMVELKKKLKEADAEKWTTESLRGMKSPDLVAALLEEYEGGSAAAEEPADEAQAAAPRRGRRSRGSEAPTTASEAVAPAEEGLEPADDEGDGDDPKDAVFARLRGQREAAERVAAGMSAVIRRELDLEDNEAGELEIASGALAAALMVFAEFIIVEVRKPKSPGRPRRDGTEAQPRRSRRS